MGGDYSAALLDTHRISQTGKVPSPCVHRHLDPPNDQTTHRGESYAKSWKTSVSASLINYKILLNSRPCLEQHIAQCLSVLPVALFYYGEGTQEHFANGCVCCASTNTQLEVPEEEERSLKLRGSSTSETLFSPSQFT